MNTIERVKSRARDRRLFLKVKIKSLAEEARIIKHAEKKHTWVCEELRIHRICVVRLEARATHLAYGFIRGKTRQQIEAKHHPLGAYGNKTLQSKVKAMVDKYGKVFDPDIEWKQNDLNHKALMERLETWWAE